MANGFKEIMQTSSVLAAQRQYYGVDPGLGATGVPDVLTDEEQEFIRSRDSFYLATVTETGWPYIQHRGGARGFLHVLDDHTLAFADYKGNRQLLSTGNLAANDRVALFLMDYPRQERLKILGHARVGDAKQEPGLASKLADPQTRRLVERIFVIEVVSFDWNCPKHITPRYTAAEVERAVAPLKARIAELEARLQNGNGGLPGGAQ